MNATRPPQPELSARTEHELHVTQGWHDNDPLVATVRQAARAQDHPRLTTLLRTAQQELTAVRRLVRRQPPGTARALVGQLDALLESVRHARARAVLMTVTAGAPARKRMGSLPVGKAVEFGRCHHG